MMHTRGACLTGADVTYDRRERAPRRRIAGEIGRAWLVRTTLEILVLERVLSETQGKVRVPLAIKSQTTLDIVPELALDSQFRTAVGSRNT
jgi:hypothetical protein